MNLQVCYGQTHSRRDASAEAVGPPSRAQVDGTAVYDDANNRDDRFYRHQHRNLNTQKALRP